MSHKDKHTNLGLELWNYPISGHFKIIASFHFIREECCCCCSTDAEHIFAQHHFIGNKQMKQRTEKNTRICEATMWECEAKNTNLCFIQSVTRRGGCTSHHHHHHRCWCWKCLRHSEKISKRNTEKKKTLNEHRRQYSVISNQEKEEQQR